MCPKYIGIGDTARNRAALERKHREYMRSRVVVKRGTRWQRVMDWLNKDVAIW